jgi:hypothetical protein
VVSRCRTKLPHSPRRPLPISTRRGPAAPTTSADASAHVHSHTVPVSADVTAAIPVAPRTPGSLLARRLGPALMAPTLAAPGLTSAQTWAAGAARLFRRARRGSCMFACARNSAPTAPRASASGSPPPAAPLPRRPSSSSHAIHVLLQRAARRGSPCRAAAKGPESSTETADADSPSASGPATAAPAIAAAAVTGAVVAAAAAPSTVAVPTASWLALLRRCVSLLRAHILPVLLVYAAKDVTAFLLHRITQRLTNLSVCPPSTSRPRAAAPLSPQPAAVHYLSYLSLRPRTPARPPLPATP